MSVQIIDFIFPEILGDIFIIDVCLFFIILNRIYASPSHKSFYYQDYVRRNLLNKWAQKIKRNLLRFRLRIRCFGRESDS